MQTATRRRVAAAFEASDAAAQVRLFFANTPVPWVFEDGRLLGRLDGDGAGFSLSVDSTRLVCHFWTPTLNLVRRVVGIRSTSAQLELTCLRLGQARPGKLVVARGQTMAGAAEAAAARAELRSAAVAAAEREWAPWRLIGTPGMLRSPLLRLVFQRQDSLLACVVVSDDAGADERALSQALILAESLRTQWKQKILAGIRLILPGRADSIPPPLAARLRWLRSEIPIHCYSFDPTAGWFEELTLAADSPDVDPLRPPPSLSPGPAPPSALRLLEEMREVCPQVTIEAGPRGWRFRLYGLEIARELNSAEAEFSFGFGREQSPLTSANRALFQRFLRELGEQRVALAGRRQPWFTLQPERWMEHLLRSDLTALDPVCDPSFLYEQVPLLGAGGRDLVDLLGVDRGGRLLVIELKADEDVDFPLQALDYWARVQRQHQAREFARMGYFPGCHLSPQSPRLWLVSPALRRHPRCEAVLKWLSPEVPWTWIGVNEDWRSRIQVVYRKDGPHA